MLDTHIRGSGFSYSAQAYTFFCETIPTYVYLSNAEILLPCYTQFHAPFLSEYTEINTEIQKPEQ